MATTNDVTGDALISKMNTEKFENNYDKIFGEKPKKERWTPPPLVMSDPLCKVCGKTLATTKECAWTGCQLNWDESRIDTIGTNGNDGLHYE